jgi:hypothetical protein
MEQGIKNLREEVARGEILLYLRKVYPESVTFLTLQHYLDGERAISIDEENLAFHIHYLAETGFLTYQVFPKRVGEGERIRLVKITKAGIDEVDGRPRNSSGVRL